MAIGALMRGWDNAIRAEKGVDRGPSKLCLSKLGIRENMDINE